MAANSARTRSSSPSVFATTSWQDIRLFSQEGSDAQAARERFCLRYQRPLYVYLRVFLGRRGADQGVAEDLVQSFFEHLLQKPRLPEEQQGEGRFRSFLIRALESFLKDEWKHDGRQKRRPPGGWVSLETKDLGEGFEAEYSSCNNPERALSRAWALQLLSRALAKARDEALAAGKSNLWAAIEPLLQSDEGEVPYAVQAERLGMAEIAFKVAVHRSRKRFQQCLRVEVARTLGWEGSSARELESDLLHDAHLRRELSDEMSHLLHALI